MTVGSLPLFLVGKSKKSDYSYWSRLLHTVVLENYSISQYFLSWELKKAKPSDSGSFVVVTGLARSGTTALTNMIYHPDNFHTISYANMPFLLAPKLWKKFYKPKVSNERERSHGDGVLFSESSIEALEEHFFKASLNDKFIHEESLTKHGISDELFSKYLKYQGLFKSNKEDTTIYLTKNNNFLLRYESLRRLSTKFIVFVVFRNPIEHSKSLLRQHQNFVKIQEEDDFVLKYMNWLGHHEFGLNQKYFDFGFDKIWEKYDKMSINYWLAIWINYYSYILKLPHDANLILINHNDLLEKPLELKQNLSRKLNIQLTQNPQEQFISRSYEVDLTGIDDDLMSKAKDIFEELGKKKIAFNSTCPATF